MNFIETLERYRALVDTYDSLELSDRDNTLEVAKDLSVTLSWLATFRIDYHKQWNAVVFKHGENMSNAAAERIAENQVPELYQCRYIMKSGYEILNVLRSHLSIIKLES